MDVTFKTPEGRFNYRVCAILLHDGKLLAMHDEVSPYYYLPGGRVLLHETAEEAIVRELREELGVEAAIVRPLWLCQSFFTEDVKQEKSMSCACTSSWTPPGPAFLTGANGLPSRKESTPTVLSGFPWSA